MKMMGVRDSNSSLTVSPPSFDDLKAAIKSGDLDLAKSLVERGAPLLDDRVSGSDAALHLAVKAGQGAMVGMLVENGADLVALGESSYPPLHLACTKGHLECVKALLHHLDVDVLNGCGRTPLQEAVQGGHPDVVSFLLDRGADVNVQDDRGRTALSKVHSKLAEKPQEADAIRAMLIDAGAKQRVGGAMLVDSPLVTAILSGDLARVRLAAKQCPDSLNDFHFARRSPLRVAVNAGFKDAVALLLDLGASFSESVSEGNGEVCPESNHWGYHGSVLDVAVRKRRVDLLKVLIEASEAQEGHQDRLNGALGSAASKGCVNATVMLLDAGADVTSTVSRNGLDGFVDMAKGEPVKALIRERVLAARPKPNRMPPHPHCAALAKAIASEGEETKRVPQGSPLHYAASGGHVDVVEVLLRNGAKVLDDSLEQGWREVEVATGRKRSRHSGDAKGVSPELRKRLADFVDGLGAGNRDYPWTDSDDDSALTWLESSDAVVNAHYVDALTPLHMAAACDLPKSTAKLISMGAYLEKRAHVGGTPLQMAVRRSGYETVKTLLDGGASMDAGRQVSLLFEACGHGNAGAARALIEAGCDVDGPPSERSVRELMGS